MSSRYRDHRAVSGMSHYGLAGFGTAAAYASALGMKDDAAKLKSIASDIYKADEYTRQAGGARGTGGGEGSLISVYHR